MSNNLSLFVVFGNFERERLSRRVVNDNALMSLPVALFGQILDCLDIHEVGKLDSAMTNKEKRPEFLQYLKEMRNATVPVSFHQSRVVCPLFPTGNCVRTRNI